MRLFMMMAAVATLASFPALAENNPGVIDGDALERQAKELLASEPDAREVTVRQEVAPMPLDTEYKISLESFDLNHDGVFDRDEVGEQLFRIFDHDGNEVIDNIEMKKPRILVFSPMVKTTIDIVRYRGDDAKVKETVEQEKFMKTTKLARFDKDKDGLSPLDFLDMSFNRVNVHDDGVIDLYEWKRAYAESVKRLHEEDFNYNN